MMKTILIIAALITLVSSSCEKREDLPVSKDSEGVVNSMPYQWKTSLSTKGNLIESFLRQNVSYQGNVLLASQEDEISKMAMLSSATGKILWQWDDLFEKDRRFDVVKQYQYGQYLAFQEGSSFYEIDLSNGTTVLKESRGYEALSMSGIESVYFVAGNFVLNEENNYVGNVYTGTFKQPSDALLILPAYSLEYVDGNNTTGGIGSAVPFTDASGDVLITYDYADAQPGWLGNNYTGLYNYTQQKSVYEKESLALNVNAYASGPAVIYEGKAYYAPAKSIVCIDVYTGKQLWKKDFPQGFAFSGYIMADGKLLANCEDTYLYALDPETGRELWKEKSSGTSSKMAHLNGVVYFTGGGDGLLHAVDIETGKHLWRLHSPDLEVNSGAWFKRRVSVLPPENEGEKGKVIVSSYLSAFCYEAAR